MMWEYLSGTIPKNAKEGDKSMDLMGQDGWELVSVIVIGSQVIAFFKRPLPKQVGV